MTLQLRDYQEKAIQAVWDYLGNHDGNPIAVLPTGCGKSLTIAEFIKRALSGYPSTRVLILQHVRELIQQNMMELIRHFPEAPIGVYSAGMGRKDRSAQILFASIQSIHNKAFLFQDPPFDIVLVDECQMIPRDSTTTYRSFLGDLKTINPYVRVVGWTATAYRTDSGMLHKGDDALFHRIAYEYNMRDAIASGYLCPPVSTTSSVQIDTTNVKTRMGEFVASQLEAAAIDPATVEAIADEIIINGASRKGWLFFGSGVRHCIMMRDALRQRGITCECIFGDTPKGERNRIIDAYKRQEIRCLSAMNVLLVGFNAPHSDLLAMARPTKSPGLWVQAVGRVLRLYPGKTDALVLCFGGNIDRFGPIDAIDIKDKRRSEEPGGAPQKVCEFCGASNPISALECAECGAAFSAPVSKLATKAADGPLLLSQVLPEWVDVTDVRYAHHHSRDGKPDSLRVDYWCGLAKHSEWVCLQHTGYARQKAVQWWQKRGGNSEPATIDEAVEAAENLRKPTQIQVKRIGKFTEIVAAKFA